MRIILGKSNLRAAPTLLTGKLWPAIRRIRRDAGPRWVAAPYVAPGATKRLELESGDVLVTRFDDETIRAGQTDPREIVKYIRAGIEVHNAPTLHAKVYVSAARAIVCSANVSANSEHELIEAGVEVTQSAHIREARRFVQELRGPIVGLEYARTRIKLFRTEQRGHAKSRNKSSKSADRQSLWIVGLRRSEPTEQEEAAALRARGKAKARMKDQEDFRLEEFTFFGEFEAREGDYVVQVISEGRGSSVVAPAQILVMEPFDNQRGKSLSVVVELRKRVRTRTLSEMDAAVRPATSKKFPRVSRCRRVGNDALERAIWREWPRLRDFGGAVGRNNR